MAETLYIRLLGPVSISIGDDDPLHFSSSRGELFVAYLAVTALHHARETLATFLWDDRTQKQSFSNLRSLLAQLPDEVKPYIDANRKTISLAEGMSVWVDALAFEEMLQREPSPEQTAEALELYRGDFLDGQFVRESRGLEEWMALTRERLQLLAIRAHQQMARYYLHRRGYAQGIFHTQELLRLDPLQEGALRLLMRLLVRAGQRNAALTQYRSFRQNLTAELGVEPAAETVTLYERIRLAKEPIPHKLPVTLTPFIGREEELAQLEARLDDPACQLLTLIGPGGTGKTRLAIAAADRRQGEYLNGIFFVPLIGIESAADLPTAVARALELPLDGQAPPHRQVLNYLREKELLLILDNFEHILDDAAAFVQEILTSAPAVKLLITSRERLYLRAEWLLEIIGLAYPELPLGSADEVEIMAQYAAVRLFANSAQRVQAEFALQPVLEAVIQICELVEGNPLAIELAAATLSRYSAAEIAQSIAETLDFLKTKMRDIEPRHRSLRAVFEHSWGLMTAEEQRVFCELSIFRGGLHLAAAQAVAHTDRPTLEDLVAQSLLRYLGDEQYEWHEVLRQFGYEILQAQPKATAVAERHARYYAALLQENEEELIGFELDNVLAVLDDEIDSIRLAWRWLVEQRQSELIRTTSRSLAYLYFIKGLSQDGVEAFGQAAVMVEKQLAAQHEPAAAAQLLWGELLVRQALFYNMQSNFTAALQTNGRAEAIAQKLDHTALLAFSAYNHAVALLEQGDVDAARPLAAQAFELAQTATEGWIAEEALVVSGAIALECGDYQEAQAKLEQAIALVDQSGNHYTAMRAYNDYGSVLWYKGAYTAAYDAYQHSLTIAQEVGNLAMEALALGNIGLVLSEQGDYTAGVQALTEALYCLRALGHQRKEANYMLNLAALYLEMYNYGRAQQTFSRALALCQSVQDRQGEAIVLDQMGFIAAFAFANFSEAHTHYEGALVIYRELEDEIGIGMTTLSVAWLRYLEDDRAQAMSLCQQAQAIAQESGVPSFEAEAWMLLGHLYGEQAQTAEATAAYKRSIELRRANGQPHLIQECYAGLARLALAQDDVPTAVSYVNKILHYLADGELHGSREPLRIYLSCYDVLQAAADGRAAEVLQAAHERLQQQAAHIDNRPLRYAFFHDPPIHERILMLASA